MITVRKQPHGLSGQTELRAPCCLSDFSDTRIQAAKHTGKTKRGKKESVCLDAYIKTGFATTDETPLVVARQLSPALAH